MLEQTGHRRKWSAQIEAQQAVVPQTVLQCQNGDIQIEKNGLPAGQQVNLITGYTDLRRSVDGLPAAASYAGQHHKFGHEHAD